MIVVGKQHVLDLYDCKADLNDIAFLIKTVRQACLEGSLTLLKLISNSFSPQGATVIALLAESHLSIHTWPEHRYAAVDIFTCGGRGQPKVAYEFILKELKASGHNISKLNREAKTNGHSDS